MMKTLTAIYCVIFSLNVCAQDFNYSKSVSTSTYNALSNANAVSNGEDWSSLKFNLAIGFPFHVCGNTYDSISILRNGFINFGETNRMTLLTFLGFGCVRDTNGTYSSISSQFSGSNGSRILKLEFKNCGLST